MSHDDKKLWDAVQVLDALDSSAAMAVRYAMIHINALESRVKMLERDLKELKEKYDSLRPAVDIMKMADV